MQFGSERINDQVECLAQGATTTTEANPSRSTIDNPLTAEEPAGRKSMLRRCSLAGSKPDHVATRINVDIDPLARAINHVGIFWTSDPTL